MSAPKALPKCFPFRYLGQVGAPPSYSGSTDYRTNRTPHPTILDRRCTDTSSLTGLGFLQEGATLKRSSTLVSELPSRRFLLSNYYTLLNHAKRAVLLPRDAPQSNRQEYDHHRGWQPLGVLTRMRCCFFDQCYWTPLHPRERIKTKKRRSSMSRSSLDIKRVP